MWWGKFSNENGHVRWRSGFGPWGYDHNTQPIDEHDETRIESGMSEAEIDVRLRRRILLRRKMYREFFGHLAIFAIVNILLWSIWYASTIDGTTIIIVGFGEINFPWPIVVTLFWGFNLVSHGIRVYRSSGHAVARREQSLQREVERERERLGLERVDYEKPKRVVSEPDLSLEKAKRQSNGNQLRLSDDGELVPVKDGDQDKSTLTYQDQQAGQQDN